MENHPDESEYQRKEVILVMGLVVFNGIRQFILGSQPGFIDEFYTADPVALVQFTMSLQVVLPAGKIPHEIPHVHMPHLVTEKEPHIFRKGGFVLGRIPVELHFSHPSDHRLTICIRTHVIEP